MLRFLAIASADVTTPRAMRPWPPSFSLANTNTVSPSAISLPPYMVFCALNANDFARGSPIAALIANAILHLSRFVIGTALKDENECSAQGLSRRYNLTRTRLGLVSV